MKKYVQEATDINIWTSIKNNTFERNKDIKEFIDGLELIDESACISLDAKWGDGKTFFVRQIEEMCIRDSSSCGKCCGIGNRHCLLF